MRKQAGNFDLFKETTDQLDGDGALLLAGSPPNPMTIGWGMLGIIWGKPVLQVFVRPTRHTYGIMERETEFTVNFFTKEYAKELALCGSRSGRDTEKMFLCGFHADKGILIKSPFIHESVFHYECRIIHKHLLDPETLDRKIFKKYYPKKDFHMVYYGEIVGTFVSEE